MAPDDAIHASRIDRLRAELAARRIDALIVSQPESRFYLSGYTGHDLPPRDSAGYLLISARQALLLTDPRTTEQAEQEAPDYQVVAYQTGVRAPEALARAIQSLGLPHVGFEAVHLPYRVWNDITGHLDGSSIQLVDADNTVDTLRVVKDSTELKELQAAVDVLDRCFTHVAGQLCAGVTEREVAQIVDAYLLQQADGSSFPPIVASGPNGSMPHAVPTDRPLESGDLVTIDIGARVHGYCSDMTRTVSIGEPRNKQLAELHRLTLAAQARAEHELRPGMTGREADALAREVLAEAGYAEAFTHSLGHGIGLEVHEPPWLSALRGTEVLRVGMVFSVEPGVYLPGVGGVRIEDLVVLEEQGARILCHSPRDLVLHGTTAP